MKRWHVLALIFAVSLSSSIFGSYTATEKAKLNTAKAVEAATSAGYEKGLKQGRLEAKPTPQACFSWWFSPEHTKDRTQQTRNYLCKSQGS